MRAAIIGITGHEVMPGERALLAAMPPAGVILFGRNIRDPVQVRALTDALHHILPPNAVVMVDQEGGRVVRLRPPFWRAHPAAGVIGRLYEADREAGLRAAWLCGALIGTDCAAAGFDVACAPVLDLRMPGASIVVGDRSFGSEADAVGRLGREMANGLLAAGIQPVAKHAPGHGRATVDSHVALPVVDHADLDADMAPFIANADLPWMMTAHLLYRAWDAQTPGTLSARVIDRLIRGRIGFTGLLVSDDLAMHALSGTPAERGARALAAGCDLALYCPGDADGSAALLAACPAVTPRVADLLVSAKRLARQRRLALDPATLEIERGGLIL
jgi:beta-N-acetylhexosaminidase